MRDRQRKCERDRAQRRRMHEEQMSTELSKRAKRSKKERKRARPKESQRHRERSRLQHFIFSCGFVFLQQPTPEPGIMGDGVSCLWLRAAGEKLAPRASTIESKNPPGSPHTKTNPTECRSSLACLLWLSLKITSLPHVKVKLITKLLMAGISEN